MKRKILIVLLAIASAICCAFAVFILGGCNNSDDTEQTDPNGGTISGGDENCEHKWSSWSTVSEATCTEKGKQERFCSVCGGKETKEIPALGHSFNTNNTCTRCGYELTPTVGLEYELITDKNSSYYAVTGLGNADAKEIVIPAYHAGKAVKKIAEEAFYGSDYITSVYLPGTINEIGKQAFYWCENLSELTISKPSSNSLIIKEQAFYGCAKLKTLSLPDGITEIYSNSFENTGYYKDKSNWENGALFLSGWLLTTDSTTPTEFTLDSSAKGIANNALSNSNITKIIIETSIKCTEKSFTNSKITSATIADRAIAHYLPKKQITELNINSGKLSEGDLYGFGYLQKLTIPSLSIWTYNQPSYYNRKFHYIFGRTNYLEYFTDLGTNDGFKEVKIDNETYFIPSNLEEITVLSGTIVNKAFSEINSITKINLGNNVNSLGDNICYHCNEQVVVNFANETEFLSTTKTTSSYVVSGSRLNYKYAKLAIDNKDIVDFKIPDGTTNIKECAFGNCAELKEVTIPSSVTSIGNYAFFGCTSLESIEIPDSVTEIGSNAFYNCTSLTSVTIPDSVTEIGSNAFSGCTSLESITVDGGNQNYSSQDGILYDRNKTAFICIPQAIKGNITIPNSVTSIEFGAFFGCTSLTSIEIPNSVTEIGRDAFYKCTSLTSVTIPDSVTKIGISAFYNCTSLTNVTIGSGVTSIGSEAFYDCTSLKGVYITDLAAWCNIEFGSSTANPLRYARKLYLNKNLVTDITADMLQGITEIKNYAFYDCDSLTSIEIPDSVTEIGISAFENCTSLTSVTIGSGVTSIGSEAFYDCTSLKGVYITDLAAWCKIDFGNGHANPLSWAHKLYLNNNLVTNITADMLQDVTEIKDYAFYDCDSLTSIEIPDSVTSIGYLAFYNCTSLESIEIPDSVTSIGYGAFIGCTSLTSVTFANTTGWEVSKSSSMSNSQPAPDLSNPTQNADYLKSTYRYHYWKRE